MYGKYEIETTYIVAGAGCLQMSLK